MRISHWLAAAALAAAPLSQAVAASPMTASEAAEVPDESDPYPWGLLGLLGLLGLMRPRRKHDRR